MDLKKWVEQVCEIAVSRYRVLKRYENQKQSWKALANNHGAVGRKQITLRRGLDLLCHHINQSQQRVGEQHNIHSQYILRLLKNNEACYQIAYDYLQREFTKNNNQINQSIDRDSNRLTNFVIQGSQVCWTRR